MFKFLLLFLLIVAYGVAKDDEKVEVFASKMNTETNIITAENEVVVVYKDYILYAKKAIYNKNSADLELFGNVRANQNGNMKLLGEYAKMNISRKTRSFKPFFMLEQKSQVWLSTEDAHAEDNILDTGAGVLSGCDATKPLWKMEFGSSDYNTDTMWLNLYNTRLYIYDIPVFYTPYFGYSLDTTRRTGLLPPIIGLSSGEGFYYEQPIYIAEQNWWDLELRPQIRTNRGNGLYGALRFVDSNQSQGALSFGYFKEKQEYVLKHGLANQKHYGFNLLYENQNVLNNWFGSDLKGQSGLYVDITDMNDVDYLNLSKNDVTSNVTSQQIISRTNLFYNTDEDYFGAYMKYYKDLRYKNNDETIQNLPSLHYHNYLNTLLQNHLLYSVDVQSNNFYRKIGKNATQTDLNIPLTLQTSLLDEYLTLGYKAGLYAQHTAFSSHDQNSLRDEKYKDGFFGRNSHTIYASSQQSKVYENFTHVIDFGTQYTFAGGEFENGYYKDQGSYCSKEQNQLDPLCDFYNIARIDRNLQLYFSQYLYDIYGSQIIYHKLSQNIKYDGIDSGAGELENELDYQISKNLNFYNNLFYNYDRSMIVKNYNKISYSDGTINLGLSHMSRKYFLNKIPDTNYLTSSVGYRYNQHYSYNMAYSYDMELKEKKSFEVGFLYEKRCWDFGLRYVEVNRPILNKAGLAESVYDKIIYILIRLKPFMAQKDKNSGFVCRLPSRDNE